MSTIPEEKRKSIRVPVDLEAHLRKDNRDYVARILNLSTEGVFVKTTHLLDANDQVDIFFHLPGLKHRIHAAAAVRWGGPMEGGAVRGAYGLGISFQELAADQKEEIETYIQNLLQA